MRDWLLVLVPVGVVVYFVAEPSHFKALMDWVDGLARWLIIR